MIPSNTFADLLEKKTAFSTYRIRAVIIPYFMLSGRTY